MIGAAFALVSIITFPAKAVFLNEAITLRQILGTALVLAGVVIITLPDPKTQAG